MCIGKLEHILATSWGAFFGLFVFAFLAGRHLKFARPYGEHMLGEMRFCRRKAKDQKSPPNKTPETPPWVLIFDSQAPYWVVCK